MSPRTRACLCVAALVLCAWPLIPAADPLPWITQGTQTGSGLKRAVVSIVGLPLMLAHGWSFMVGSGALALMAWLRIRQGAVAQGRFGAIVFPLISLGLIGVQALPFLSVPAGSSIRPLAWAAYAVGGALALAVISVVRSISALRRGGPWWVCLGAVLLSVGIVIVPSLSLKAVAAIKGFSLAP